jgi:hypothetical protein
VRRPVLPAELLRDDLDPLDLPALRDIAARLAAARWLWRPLVRHESDRRWYTRLVLTGAVEVWLIGWSPGQHTDVHDHGGALGALAVAEGTVEEDLHRGDWSALSRRRHESGGVVGFPARHVHRVLNRSDLPATTVHAYSPPELPLRYRPTAVPDGLAPTLAVPGAMTGAMTTTIAAPDGVTPDRALASLVTPAGLR